MVKLSLLCCFFTTLASVLWQQHPLWWQRLWSLEQRFGLSLTTATAGSCHFWRHRGHRSMPQRFLSNLKTEKRNEWWSTRFTFCSHLINTIIFFYIIMCILWVCVLVSNQSLELGFHATAGQYWHAHGRLHLSIYLFIKLFIRY